MTDDELTRFDKLLCNGPLSRDRARELVAEIRMLRDRGWWATAVAAEGTIERLRSEVAELKNERDRLERERAELQHRENQTLTSSEAFRAGVVAAMTQPDELRTLMKGWGGLEEYVEKRVALLRTEIEEMRPVFELALDARWSEPGGLAEECLNRAIDKVLLERHVK